MLLLVISVKSKTLSLVPCPSDNLMIPGMPLAASFPHFLHGDDIIRTYVDGLEPDPEKHGSYVVVEPVSVGLEKWTET